MAPTRLLTLDQIEELPDLEFLIDSILPNRSFGVLYGEPGCFKTFVALSLAMSVAAGTIWVGRQTRKGAVLYVAAEGIIGFKYRLRAYRRVHGGDGANIRFLPEGIQLRDDEAMATLRDRLAEEAFRPDLIILDTLARVTVGADENSARDMGEVVDAVDALRRDLEAAVLLIHHTRKDGGSERGSSALRGAADVMIECKKSDSAEQIVVLRCAKMKDAEPFADIEIGLEKVYLGGGRSSLVAGAAPPLLQRKTIFPAHVKQVEKLVEILRRDFNEPGASHGDLKSTFCAETRASESTFARTLNAAKEGRRIRQEGDGKSGRYFVGVSVK
jgi:hypothetical protein